MKTIYYLLIIGMLAFLTGCIENNTSYYYTYGPSKSCYKPALKKDCKSFIANDKLTISVNQSSQEVTYQLAATKLDDSNIIFRTLANCKVVDKKNFACDDFGISDGKVINSKLFGSKILSDSSMIYAVSDYLDISFQEDFIKFTNNNSWVIPVSIFAGFVLLAMLN